MNLRQKLQIVILLALILFCFASYHEGTGSTVWLQWLTVITLMAFMLVFDLAFTNESQFLFDPDADNWRRKTVSAMRYDDGGYLRSCFSKRIDVDFALPKN
jgi:hypothetical protein